MFSQDTVLALAAFSQATHLASDIALTGQCDHLAFEVLIQAIYAIDSPSTAAIYPSPSLHVGLQSLRQLLAAKPGKIPQAPWLYLWKLNTFVIKLSRRPVLLAQLHTRLNQAIQQRLFFQQDPERALACLSELYGWLVQQIPLSFHIKGKAQYLHKTHNITQIQVLLLAGIRAGVLWRQLGGTLWQLWWHRHHYRNGAAHYLSTHHTLL